MESVKLTLTVNYSRLKLSGMRNKLHLCFTPKTNMLNNFDDKNLDLDFLDLISGTLIYKQKNKTMEKNKQTNKRKQRNTHVAMVNGGSGFMAYSVERNCLITLTRFSG